MISEASKYLSYLYDREEKVRSFLLSFYVVGCLGMIVPFLRPIFIQLTPYALLFNSVILLLFHKGSHNLKTGIVFGFILLAGFGIELLGVNTGNIFGEYYYGNGLGIKIGNTPLLIGLNWLLLVYLSANLTAKLKWKAVFSVIAASVVMIGYDIILEQVAPALDMWYWAGNTIPFQNYLAWFVVALIFHILVKVFGVNTTNPLARVVFICQLLFFVVIYVFLKLGV
ncbi:MAG TPA: carotenoid biosynthesis protein [Bacteroidales bacterium]|nr:carotenoid biosynthesis protein [Bacteroidales bacterium]